MLYMNYSKVPVKWDLGGKPGNAISHAALHDQTVKLKVNAITLYISWS